MVSSTTRTQLYCWASTSSGTPLRQYPNEENNGTMYHSPGCSLSAQKYYPGSRWLQAEPHTAWASHPEQQPHTGRHGVEVKMHSKVLFLAVLLALHHATDVRGEAAILIGETTPSTKFSASPAAPTDLIVKLDGAVAENDRVYIYLPLFGGATNSFGTYGASVVSTPGPGNYEAVQPTPANPATNGVQGRNTNSERVIGGLKSAFWDAPTETLRVVIGAGAADVTEIFVESKFLRIGANPGGAPNGKGPLPPYAGVKDRWWYRMANVRTFAADKCTGGADGRDGFPPEECTVADATEVIFDIATSSKLTTSGSRLFVHPEIGEVGTFKLPHFAYSSIHGSSTGLGQSNCMTVTFIPSFTFTSTVDNHARIDITGLGSTPTGTDTTSGTELSLYSSLALCEAGSPSMPAGLSGYFQNIAEIPSSNRATFNKAEGKFSMQLQAGRYIEAFQVVTFTFQLDNPTAVTEAVVPRLSFQGMQCDAGQFCSTGKEVAVAAAPFQVADKILGSEPNEFKVREIWQATTDPGTASRIHVTLAPNVLITSTTITISNLCISTTFDNNNQLKSNKDNFGSRFNGNLPIEAVTDDDLIIDKDPVWDNTAKELKLSVGTRGLLANKRHAFAFLYNTALTANEAGCTPRISIGGSGTPFAAMDMDHTDFGKVDPPMFKKLQIGQSSTRPGLTNYICVTLTPNKDLSNEAKITITGLSNTLAVDTAGAQLLRCPRALVDQSIERTDVLPAPLENSQFANDQFAFDKDAGAVTLTLKAGGTILKDSEVNFAIPLRNGFETTECATPQLAVSGTGSNAWTMVATDFEAPSATKRALEGGMEDGDVCPLKVYQPKFTTMSIGQSDAKAGADNVLTVTLRTNVDLVAPSKTTTHPSITIDGLFGAETMDTTNPTEGLTELAVQGVEGKNFMKLDSAEWTRANGRLVVKLASVEDSSADKGVCKPPSVDNWQTGDYCMKAGFRYVFQFTLKNPETKQPAVTPWILGEFKTSQNSESRFFQSEPFQYLVVPEEETNQPLFVLAPGENDFIKSSKIGQRNASPESLNALCVTMTMWRNLQPTTTPATFTVSGLTGFETADNANLPLFGADGSSAVSTALAGLITSDEAGDVAATAKQNKVRWDKTAGTLSGNILSGQTLQGGREYKFCVNLMNPESQACLAPKLTVEFEGAGTTDTQDMTKDETTALVDYLEGSACPGFVPGPKFTLASLRHSTNVTATTSQMYLDLAVNKELTAGNKVTLEGLEGFATLGDDDSVEMEVTKDGKLDTATLSDMKYDASTGVLTFDVTGSLKPKTLFPSDAVAKEEVLLIQFALKNGLQAKKPLKVYITSSAYPNMVKQAVVVGPERERQDVLTLNPGENFCYSDWLFNDNEAQGVTVKFSEIEDGASVALPPGFAFPRDLCFGGDEVTYDQAPYPAEWQFQQAQVASTVVNLRVTGNEGDSAVDLPLVSSLLREISTDAVPEYEAPEDSSRRRRRLLVACPEGFETRMTLVGDPADTACGCERSCGLKATCSVRRAGRWTSVLIPEAVCTAPERRPDSNAGAIVGAVLAAFFAILFGTIGYVYTQYPELFKAPTDEEEEQAEEDPKAGVQQAQTRDIQPMQQPMPMQQPVFMSPAMPMAMAPMQVVDPYGQPAMTNGMGSMPPMMPQPIATPQGSVLMQPMQPVQTYAPAMSAPMMQQGYY